MPSARTPRTISSTWSNWRLSFLGLRHAAPMQKRDAPSSLACRAFSSTVSTLSSASDSRPVLFRALCEQ